MSLTSTLKQPDSPMSRFMAAHLPDYGAVLHDLQRQLAGALPPISPDKKLQPHYRMLGRTIDHRLRISLGSPTGGTIRAGVALARLDDDGFPSAEVRAASHRIGVALLERLDQHNRTPEDPMFFHPADEEHLVRLCYIAAHFEDIYRNSRFVPGNWLAYIGADATLDDLVSEVPAFVVDDIRQQLDRAARGPIGNLRTLPAEQRICGPVFAGSDDVRGADADYILWGRLIDCKATIRPDRLDRDTVYQLAGYLLLDYDDTFGVDHVGLYLSRQGALVEWTVDDFLGLLRADIPLPRLRGACEHALTDGESGTAPPPPHERSPLPRPRNAPPIQDSLFDDPD